MSKRSKIFNRFMFIALLALCLQGCLSINPTSFVGATKVNIQAGEIYSGIHIDALASTNTSVFGNWTWAETQLWCSIDNGVYVIEDMLINDTSGTTRGSGIFINNSHDVNFRIENCTITRVNALTSYSSGIDIENSSRGVIYNNTVDGTNPIGCGIQLLSYNCENITIEQNVVKNILRHGILAYGGNEIHVLNNDVTNIAYNGIYFYEGTQNSTIAFNYVNNTNYNQMSGQNGGIKLLDDNTDYNEIYNNTVMNAWRGVYIRDASNNTIHNNTIHNCQDTGIVLSTNSNNNNVTDNSVHNGTGEYEQDIGIWLASSHNNSIQRNIINNNLRYGIYFQGSKWNIITDNTINSNKLIGVYLTSFGGNNTIDDNDIYNNNLGIGLDSVSFNNITENTLVDNNYCIHEYDSSNNILDNNDCTGSTYLLPIFIDDSATGVDAKNWTWAETQSWCTGSGEELDPYIIENQHIMGFSFEFDTGIIILNSDKYVIIRNCVISNFGDGIMVTNVTNMQLTNNNCSENEYTGIYFNEYCDFNTLSGNNCSNTETGIYIEYECYNNTIINNILNDNGEDGINLEYDCDNNTIIGNTIDSSSYGIYLYEYCDNNILKDNILENIEYEGISIDGYCNDNIVSGNIIKNCEEGVYLSYECYRNQILENVIVNTIYGIYLDTNIENTTIWKNVLDNNTNGVWIQMFCDNNILYENFFVRNDLHARDNGNGNKWNTTTIGNYWDNWTTPDTDGDGIVDTPYTFIEGSAGSNDSMPIAEDGAPVITIRSPKSKDRIGDDAPSFDVEVTDVYVWEMWYTLDGGLTNYTFTENGFINQTAWDAVPYAKVTIMFYARDIAGNVSAEEVTLRKYNPVLQRRIILWSIIGVVGIIGAGGYFLIKFWKIKLNE